LLNIKKARMSGARQLKPSESKIITRRHSNSNSRPGIITLTKQSTWLLKRMTRI